MGDELRALVMSRAALLALAACRVSGFVLLSPFPGANVPTQQRIGLVVVLAWLVAYTAPVPTMHLELGVPLVGPALLEVCLGVAMGFAFRVLFSVADALGQALSQGTGLSTPTTLDPALEAADAPLARMVTLFAMLLALAIGAHRVALAYLLESFRAMPVGSLTGGSMPATTGALLDLTADALATGVRLGLPVMAVGLVVQVALALISRAAPSLQIFSVGLGVMLASGFVVISATAGDMGRGLVEHLGGLGPALERVLSAMSSHA